MDNQTSDQTFGQTPGQEKGQEKGQPENQIPLSRFNDVNEKRKLLADENEKLKAQLELLQRGQSQTPSQEKGQSQTPSQPDPELARLRQEQESIRQELELARAGVPDPEDQALVKFFWDRLPKTERPSLGQYVSDMKAKPDQAPKGLQALLGIPGAGGAGNGRAGLGGSNAGGAGSGQPKGAWTAAEIAAMSPEEYKKNRDQILKGYRAR